MTAQPHEPKTGSYQESGPAIDDPPTCAVCGEPMPEGETMFKFHGYSGPCPKPPLPPKEKNPQVGPNPESRQSLAAYTATDGYRYYPRYVSINLLGTGEVQISVRSAEHEGREGSYGFATMPAATFKAMCREALAKLDPGRPVPHHGSGPDNL